MPRIDADRIVRHGRHTDYFWPGVIHSVWKWRGFMLRREQVFTGPNHVERSRVAWQLHFSRGRRKGGARYEVENPNQVR